MGWRKRIVLLFLALLLAGALAWTFRPQPVPVETATVTRQPMQVSVEEEGRTRVIERYEVTAPVAGHLGRVALKVGDPVSRGQRLFVITPSRSPLLDPRSRVQAQAEVSAAEARLRGARAELNAARAVAELARADLSRTRLLYGKGEISRDAFDRAVQSDREARARVDAAESAVAVARHGLAQAQAMLAYAAGTPDGDDAVSVTSPISGRVLAVQRESAGVVTAAEPVVAVGDPTRLEVVADLLTADAVRVGPGTPVTLRDWGGPSLQAVVRRVEPAAFTKVSALGVDEQRTRVISDITSPRDEWRALGDGYRVEAEFVLWRAADALTVPEGAVFRRGDGWAVFRVNDGRAHLHPVSLGHRNGLTAEVVGGLDVGDVVVVYPPEAVSDGAAVTGRRSGVGQ
ncbi:MAG TPA: efflux RND transporter periplasmic adaptor subunit [Gammaproteobacteria bacterium]|nr:efflux RND transporter periplasmic adaptor subunit [Gammaproteobacteria bacterium]